MDIINEPNYDFIQTKTVEELKDICRENNICGFSRLRKDELRDLIISYYEKNPDHSPISNPFFWHSIFLRKRRNRKMGGRKRTSLNRSLQCNS